MSNIKQLKENNVPIYPITHENSVIDDDGISISNKVNNLKNEKAEKVHRHNYSDIDNTPNIINNLTSTSANSSLSANQGKVLNDTKVDKISGKGLSTNDFTNEYKTKVDTSATKIAEIENNLTIINETVEGSQVSINNTLEAYLQNIEIKGNTIQNELDLSDIKSTGDKVQDQELYKIPIVVTGKNINPYSEHGGITNTGEENSTDSQLRSGFIRVTEGITYHWRFYNGSALNMGQTWVVYYGTDKVFKSIELVDSNTFTANFNGYIRVYRNRNTYIGIIVCANEIPVQFEDYKEHKIDILSPTPLESIAHAKGKISDRIIEKDGVWGVEKNIYHIDLLTWDKIYLSEFETSNLIRIVDVGRVFKWYSYSHAQVSNNMFEELIVSTGWSSPENQGKLATVISDKNIDIVVSKDINTKAKALKYIEGLDIRGWALEPQFIPLPRAQQVKLKTFAGTTNISFYCEIPGTIKVDASKSLAATVDSNTQEISKINNKVADIEGLKEVQEMAYDTTNISNYKGSIACAKTKVGTTKDFKIVGNTLVNLNTAPTVSDRFDNTHYVDKKICPVDRLKINKDYTFIVFKSITSNHNREYDKLEFGVGNSPNVADAHPAMTINETSTQQASYNNNITREILVLKLNFTDFKGFKYLSWRPCRRNTPPAIGEFADYTISSVLLEGDYTQRPYGYFEGLFSVGSGVDTIDISSRNVNLFNDNDYIKAAETTRTYDGKDLVVSGKWYVKYSLKHIPPNTDFIVCANVEGKDTSKAYLAVYKHNGALITNSNISKVGYSKFNSGEGVYEINFYSGGGEDNTVTYKNVGIYLSNARPEYTAPKEDKKPLLYKNNEGNWVVIDELRGITDYHDTVEVNDTSQYYHKRTGKKVITDADVKVKTDYTNLDYIIIPKPTDSIHYGNFRKDALVLTDCPCRCNTEAISNWDSQDLIGGFYTPASTNNYWIGVNKGTTLEQAKKMVVGKTIVYPLNQEQIFEVSPLFLDTYNDTTLISCVNSVINPNLEFKITSYITNLISSNTKRIKQIENDFYNYTVVQNKMMLTSRYSADLSSFKVDVSSVAYKTEDYDTDLYNLIKDIILVGKENYNKLWIEECITFYWMDFVISDEMHTDLTNIIESQHLDQSEQTEPMI